MADKDASSLEQRVSALENRLAERDAVVAFIARVNSSLADTVLGVRPFSDCEKGCLKIRDTQERLNCMLKCIADGKIAIA
jgi:hypothetical protein